MNELYESEYQDDLKASIRFDASLCELTKEQLRANRLRDLEERKRFELIMKEVSQELRGK